MIKFLSKVIFKLGKLFISVSGKMYQDAREKRAIPWFEIQGDKTLRLDYELDEKSLVFDLGGYEGQWASDIFSKYSCFIYIFEPVEEFFEKIRQRFSKNKKISVYKFGLGKQNQNAEISLEKSASSMFKKVGRTTNIKILKAVDFFREKILSRLI